MSAGEMGVPGLPEPALGGQAGPEMPPEPAPERVSLPPMPPPAEIPPTRPAEPEQVQPPGTAADAPLPVDDAPAPVPEPEGPAGEPGELAILGVDPGRRWTAAVLRQGDRALHGWTIGPVDEDGRPSPAAVDNVHDLMAWARYMARILDEIESTMSAHAQATGQRAVLAVEVAVPPRGRQIALADWLVPRQIVAGLLSFDPNLILIPPDKHGARRPVERCYPPELWPAKGRTGGRPASWGPSEARRGERDHERAAFDVAGAAAALLAAAPPEDPVRPDSPEDAETYGDPYGGGTYGQAPA